MGCKPTKQKYSRNFRTLKTVGPAVTPSPNKDRFFPENSKNSLDYPPLRKQSRTWEEKGCIALNTPLVNLFEVEKPFVHIYGKFTNSLLHKRTMNGCCRGYSNSEEALQVQRIGITSRKGIKSGPNQDGMFAFADAKRILLGVFDGHGQYGHSCSYTIQQIFPKLLLINQHLMTQPDVALRESLLQADEVLKEVSEKEGLFTVGLSGTTAAVVLIKENTIYTANVGDSRVILGKLVNNQIKGFQLTRDHSPEDLEERKRIESRGGEVRPWEVTDVPRMFKQGTNFPGLSVSRSLGDEFSKVYGIIPEPEITIQAIEPDFQFVACFSDGLWAYLSTQEIAEFIYKFPPDRANEAAISLVSIAEDLWKVHVSDFSDDISCIIKYFLIMGLLCCCVVVLLSCLVVELFSC